ncbi:sugar phosphate isomerase/epimerase family protein [Paenibacillus sp.]|uniref:sugar phosphate isomerase/epimerase family protein n=1 Tax=Paenibacillus sp. TaxID=58172 RepID=UPI002810EDA1|nr:sugar phosphate isomerase/epimerase family protein [Paenibacillus sp.]
MKLALSMWSVHQYWYDGEWDVFDFLEFAAATKAEGVELLSIFWKDRETELPLAKERLAALGLRTACYAACNNFVSADAAEREAQLKEVTDAVDAAAYLGAFVVRVFSGDLPRDDSLGFEQGLEYVIDGLRRAARYAESKGIVLCLENHGLFAGKSGQVRRILREVGSPALKSAFDTGNFLLVDQQPTEALEELIAEVKHVHVKDFALVGPDVSACVLPSLEGKRYQGKIAGQGEVDLQGLLTSLRRSGYDGWYTVEFEGVEEQRFGSEQALAYVRELLSAIEVNN